MILMRMTMSARRASFNGWAVWAAAGSLLIAGARAHTLPISYLAVVPDANYLHLELVFNPFELKAFAELDSNRNQRLDIAELESARAGLEAKLLRTIQVEIDGQERAPETAGLELSPASHHASWRAHFLGDFRRARIAIRSSLADLTSGFHLSQVTLHRNGRTQVAQLSGQSGKVTFESMGEAEAGPRLSRESLSKPRPSLRLWGAAILMGLAGTGFVLRQTRNRKPCSTTAKYGKPT